MKRDRFEQMVADAMDGYQWNARKRKSPVNLTAIAATLLRKEHAAVRRLVVNTHKITVAAFKKSILAALDRRAKGGTK